MIRVGQAPRARTVVADQRESGSPGCRAGDAAHHAVNGQRDVPSLFIHLVVCRQLSLDKITLRSG